MFLSRYNNDNRITQIKDGSNNVVANYAYDALGRRIQKQDVAAGLTTRYYYDGDRVLLETDGGNNDQRAYVYGNYIDEVLVMTDYTAYGNPDYFFAQDHLYSTVALFDAAGAVIERYEYDAYGQVRIMDAAYNSRTASSYANTCLFTGRTLDTLNYASLKIYYYRARYYDPETGRFLQRDPLEYVDGMNLYEYVRSMPLAGTDPLGLTQYMPWPGGGYSPYPGVPPLINPPYNSGYDPTPDKCKQIKKKWDKKIRAKALELRSSLEYVTLEGGMPYRHCFWNCMMVIGRGREYSERMSAKKEELDNLMADKGIELIKAGCWEFLSPGEKKRIAEAARSADQPSDFADKETGRTCGEGVTINPCALPFVSHPAYTYESPITGAYSSARSYCRACCTQLGVPPDTPDGPGAGRDWGEKAKEFPPEYWPPIVKY